MAVNNSVGKKNLQRLKLTEVKRTRREELGRGSYAAVFEVMVQGTPCAAKEVHPILMSDKCKENFYAECIQSSQLLHPNIVQFMGIHYPSRRAELPWLVMELMYISLTGLIEQRVKKGKDISFHFKVSMLVDICQGLQFLHSKSIAHRDLSSNNILLTKHLVAKIADLGMAKVMSRDDGQRHTMAPGTQMFMPPEALEGTDEAIYGITIDVFSLECICLHVISMQWPMPKLMKQRDSTTGKIVALTELERREHYLTGTFQQFPTLRALVCQCLDDFPEKRPAIEVVLECLRAVHSSVVSNNIVQLCDCVANYKGLLYQKDQKDQKLAQNSEQLKCKERELTEKDEQLNKVALKFREALEEKKQLTAKLLETKKQLALKHEELAEAKKQLIVKGQQLIESQKRLEELQSHSQISSSSSSSDSTMPGQRIPSFNPYQQPFQIKQQQPTPVDHHHDAPQAEQMMPMSQPATANIGVPPTITGDTNALLGNTPHMPYLTTLGPAVMQQHHSPSMVPSVNTPTTMTKHFKAIKTVNPETMKKVDTDKIPLAS